MCGRTTMVWRWGLAHSLKDWPCACCLLPGAVFHLVSHELSLCHWIFFILFNNSVHVRILVWLSWRLTLTVILQEIMLFKIFYHFFPLLFPQTIPHMVLHLWCMLTNSPAVCIPCDRSFWHTVYLIPSWVSGRLVSWLHSVSWSLARYLCICERM